MTLLVEQCHLSGIKDIDLFCAKGKAGFYLKNGFARRPDDAPGMQYARAPGTDIPGASPAPVALDQMKGGKAA